MTPEKGLDFITLVEKDTELRRVASTCGGEFAGACPFCGGRDRFHLQPDRGRWLCRYCTNGKWKDPIDYLMRRDKLDYQAARALVNSVLPDLAAAAKHRQTEIIPPYLPPPEPWQEMAARIIARGETDLWGSPGQEARDYLQHRGLRDETIRFFHLGYSPGYFEKCKGRYVRVSAGILLHCRARQSLWHVKIRLLPGQSYSCRGCGSEQIGPGVCEFCGEEIPRYLAIPGSATASIFNAPVLLHSDIGLLVEGEFDAMLAHQELACLGIGCVTLGSATNMPDLAVWGTYLVKPERLAAAYDNDEAGNKGLEALVKLAPKIERLHLPGEKDINDYHLAGGDLQVWAIQTLGLR